MTRASRTYAALIVGIVAVGAIGFFAQQLLNTAEPLRPFSPPDAAAQVAAVGGISGLRPDQRAAFDPRSADFEPIPDPGPSDWLANHREAGQTYAEFLKTRRNRPDAQRSTLYIWPIGKFGPDADENLLEPLREYSEIYFGMPTKLLPTEKDADSLGITTRINPHSRKRQLLTKDILKMMPRKLPRDGFCMLAVTTEDLYPEESWNFVFGQASLRNRVGVFSFARYDPTFYGEEAPADLEKLVLKRSCDVLVHETAHMFAIRHCIFFHCIMNGSNNLPESDAAPMHLCPVCLRKTHNATKFDLAGRYEKLAEFYGEHGFDEERDWAKRREQAVRH